VLDHENSKKMKNVSNGENLSEPLKDERLDTLPNLTHQDRSTILIEPTELVSIGIE